LFLLRKPSEDAIQWFLSSQRDLPFSYKEVGALPGYAVDRLQVKLGDGAEAYEPAVEALRWWRQFDLGWARLLPPDAPMASVRR
jgi:hypothetical protein